MKGYGKKLKELRGARSQTEIANAIKVAPSAIAMYESEQRMPRDDVKIKLASLFKTTVQYIFYT